MPTTNQQTSRSSAKSVKPYKGLAMEGPIARWYTKVRGRDEELGQVVSEVCDTLPTGSRILEVAPGPGYLAIELAKTGRYTVVGLDISRSFVEIARAKARDAGVEVDFHHGNASAMPFTANSFDFIVCRAAFKNFTEPVQAIREMHRVLKPGGTALIIDLRGDASPDDINAYVNNMGLSRINTFMTKMTFQHMLLKNAYKVAQIRQFVAQTNFATADIREDALGMEIRLEK